MIKHIDKHPHKINETHILTAHKFQTMNPQHSLSQLQLLKATEHYKLTTP